MSRISFTNNDTCTFYPPSIYPSFSNVSTSASSAEVQVDLQPGTWTVGVYFNNTYSGTFAYSWAVVGEDQPGKSADDEDSGFWSTQNIIIISVLGGLFLLLLLAAAIGTLMYIRRNRSGYESV